MGGDLKVVIVGGGIIGLATAHRLLQDQPDLEVTVVEKEADVGLHQSSHNSGVLHAGLYYRPDSLKARLAVSGIRQMTAFCEEHAVPHEVCGKVVVAVNSQEVAGLRELHRRGTANGLRGLRWLGADELRELEPHCAGVAGLHVPEEGIVDYAAVCRVMRQRIEAAGGVVRLRSEVTAIRRTAYSWDVVLADGDLAADFLITCAGLHSDRVAALAGEHPAVRIVPFRGEYFRLRPESESLVRNLIYPVPDPAFPFLGVHFTRMIGGGIEAGPNAVLALAREGYRKAEISVRDAADALSFPGLWAFLWRHRGMCWAEARRSFSRSLFRRSLQRLVPDVSDADLEPGGAGVRAQAMTPAGELVYDFVLTERDRALFLLNAPSPGATASLAIGGEIARRVLGRN